jgi:hypothetical protein
LSRNSRARAVRTNTDMRSCWRMNACRTPGGSSVRVAARPARLGFAA